MTTHDARRAAEAAARTSYGRLVALVASRSRDVAAAEDALADAFAAALATWPSRGIPDRPEAWLLTVARRGISRRERAQRVRNDAGDVIRLLHEESQMRDPAMFPDARLKLMFVCAHPAIDPGIRTPLMLQAVLGLDAARIAAAFLVAPAAMGQRLVRAKAKIRDAGLRFETPDPELLAPRLTEVADAVYAAYGTGWDALPGGDAGVRGLTAEAIFLARLLVQLLPGEAEPKGLLALLLYCEARARARRRPDGAFVPLAAQDVTLWDREMIIEAESLLTDAAMARRFGRYQCEAAIQSVHSQRAVTGVTQWDALVTLYDVLASHSPSLGVMVSRAAVLAEAQFADQALAALDRLPMDRVVAYQPYWATRAHVLQRLGRAEQADEARRRAIGLTEDPAIRAFLGGTRPETTDGR